MSREAQRDLPAGARLDAVGEEDLALVRDSHARIGSRDKALAIGFFGHLHERVPRLRRFFPQRDTEKRAVAKELFDFIVAHLDSLVFVQSLLERMGRRGLLDTVAPADVSAVRGCFLAALGEVDDGWSRETERAWSRLYDWAASAVQRGAEVRRSAR